MLHDEITEKIIVSAFKVYNELGSGFLEKVYENALSIKLKKEGVSVKQQFPISVYYNGIRVGDYYADILVENTIIVELKAILKLSSIHEAQVVNYLSGTGLNVGLLINFSEKIEIKRKYRKYKSKYLKQDLEDHQDISKA